MPPTLLSSPFSPQASLPYNPLLLWPSIACFLSLGAAGFQSSNFLFSPLGTPEGPSPRRLFLFSLKSSSTRVTVLTASNHSPYSTGSLHERHRNASSGSWSSIIFLRAILVTLAQMFRYSISSNNLAMSLRYMTKPISCRPFSASWVRPKHRRACPAKTCQNWYPASAAWCKITVRSFDAGRLA